MALCVDNWCCGFCSSEILELNCALVVAIGAVLSRYLIDRAAISVSNIDLSETRIPNLNRLGW